MSLSRFVLPYADIGSGIRPSSGAKLFFFETGTSTPKNTYNCPDGTTANSNPVISDSTGVFPDIFMTGSYKVILQDRNSVQQWEADPVKGVQDEAEIVARSLNVQDSEVIYSADTTTVLDNVLYIYDATVQTTWKVPTLNGTGEAIISVVGNQLITVGGTYTLSARILNDIRFEDFINLADYLEPMDLATGVGPFNDAKMAEAENKAYDEGKALYLPGGAFRLENNHIRKAPLYGDGKHISLLIYEDGSGWRNYTNFNNPFPISRTTGVGFISNQEPSWNATDAGDAWVPGITRWDVRLKYGQRVKKGNKTTTPNNILSNTPSEQQAGTGFWNKDFTQWMQTDGIEVDISDLPAPNIGNTENIFISGPNSKSIDNCAFVGFEKDLVLCGVQQTQVFCNDFESSNYGTFAKSLDYVGGSSAARTTTVDINNNNYIDCDVSLYAFDYLQSEFRSNVCQPSRCGVYAVSGGVTGSSIMRNYFEIGHSFFYHQPNQQAECYVYANFCNSSFSFYNVWANNGSFIHVHSPVGGNLKVHFEAGVQKSTISDGYEVETGGVFFARNGNKWKPGESKEYYIKTTGVGGTSFTWTVESPQNDIRLDLTGSQAGILFEPANDTDYNYEILSTEILDVPSVALPFAPQTGDIRQNRAKFYKNTTDGSQIDLRVDGVSYMIKIIYN